MKRLTAFTAAAALGLGVAGGAWAVDASSGGHESPATAGRVAATSGTGTFEEGTSETGTSGAGASGAGASGAGASAAGKSATETSAEGKSAKATSSPDPNPKFSLAYSTTPKDFNSPPLGRSLRLSTWGTISFTRQAENFHLIYKDIKLTNATARVSVLKKCGGSNPAPAKATGAEMVQSFSESSCKANVEVAVGLPWAVSFTPTLNCGKRRVGQMKTRFDAKDIDYSQYNSGVPLNFKGSVYGGPSVLQKPHQPLCLVNAVSFKIWNKSKSDSFETKLKACVTPVN
ncbi:hypothetical protein [Actinomadura fibrosa]|uniref:Secreted protein n=1 Tax=Actinomadura fibrosa TaxID=111802 RepID=A0ABW2XY07_9ACTN|nr:hypothetical protein [Actinomadura fibrosa]